MSVIPSSKSIVAFSVRSVDVLVFVKSLFCSIFSFTGFHVLPESSVAFDTFTKCFCRPLTESVEPWCTLCGCWHVSALAEYKHRSHFLLEKPVVVPSVLFEDLCRTVRLLLKSQFLFLSITHRIYRSFRSQFAHLMVLRNAPEIPVSAHFTWPIAFLMSFSCSHRVFPAHRDLVALLSQSLEAVLFLFRKVVVASLIFQETVLCEKDYLWTSVWRLQWNVRGSTIASLKNLN